jgi:hypothetical protein
MSIATIGLNVRTQFVRNMTGLKSDIRRIGGGVLSMDGAAGDLFAETSVVRVFRRWHERDKELHTFMSPEQWVQSCSIGFPYDTYHQCHNEPYITSQNVDAFVDWNVRMLNLPSRARQAVGTFAVGNPHESLVKDGRFDRMLQALRADDALMLHEYFRTDSVPEAPWWTGRIIYWLERMKLLNTRCKTIIIGEYGRDFGGGAHDGWRSQGWSAQQYADKLIAGMRGIYALYAKQYGVRIHAMVYAVGQAGAHDQWASFDVEGEGVIYDAMAEWNKAQMTIQPQTPPDLGAQRTGIVTRVAASYVNVREQASASSRAIGQLLAGTPIVYRNAIPGADGKQWRKIDAPFDGYAADWLMTITQDVVESNKIVLNVPYVSQLGGDADLRSNDCGIACALMVWRYQLQEAGLRFPRLVTVDALIPSTPLVGADNPLAVLSLVGVMDGLGVNATRKDALTLAAIRQHIRNGNPVVALVAYSAITGNQTQRYGHYLVVTGMSDQAVYMHDPYEKGAGFRMTHAAFEAALRETVSVGASGVPNLGITVEAA